MSRLVWLALVWAGIGAGQAGPAPARWHIATLAVEGNRHYTREQVLAVAGLKVGQVAGKEDFDAAYDRLVASGAFEKVDYRFEPAPGKQGYAATFRVTEVEQVYPVRFEELGAPDAEIAAALKRQDPLFGDSIPATAPALERHVRSLEALLASRGREEKVTARVVAAGPDRFEVLFRPARNLPAVAEVSFTGNEVIPTKRLQEAFSPVAVGALYTEARLRELLDASVRPLYEARGHLRVAFGKIAAEPVADVQGLSVEVAVQEGEAYELRNARVEGGELFEPATLLKNAGLKTGATANMDEVKEGAERIRGLFRRNGYLRAETTVDRAVDDAAKTVDVVIRVEEGPRFLFGKLAIEGLDLEGEAAVRRMWTLQEGKPFDPEYPEYFLKRVREAAIFDNLKTTRAAVALNEQTRAADVTLFFNK